MCPFITITIVDGLNDIMYITAGRYNFGVDKTQNPLFLIKNYEDHTRMYTYEEFANYVYTNFDYREDQLICLKFVD